VVPLIFPTIICAGPYRNSQFVIKIPENIRLVYQSFQFKKKNFSLPTSVADPLPAVHFDADPGPDPTFNCDADADPEPTTHFFPNLYPPMIKNDPLKLPPFHFDAEPDPAFHFLADSDLIPDLAFHFDADADPGEQ
jgi:hypothetical protein